jgi:hypothetical protein
VTDRDWLAWHRRYDDPTSPLARRLELVQERIRLALDGAAPGPVRVISACAGQGRDLLGVLVDHPRRADVSARLVERDPRNAALARKAALAAGLTDVEVVTGDASMTDAYAGAVPADLILMCGVFGNISDSDIARTVGLLPTLCAPAALVVWTRTRRAPDITTAIRAWFTDAGFAEVSFAAPGESETIGVGAARLLGEPVPMRPRVRMFTFVGSGSGSDSACTV